RRADGLCARGDEGELPEDPGQLVLAVDAADPPRAKLRLERIDADPPFWERMLSGERRLGRTWARRFPPTEPVTLAYDATHRALIASLLASKEWRGLFASGAELPPGLGIGYDERVVEYPWLFSRGLRGRVLDAGSVLNHRHVVEAILEEVDELTITTLAPEPVAFISMAVSYLFADLRELPLRDDWFDEVVCLSTLEHVGMDTAVYGVDTGRAADPGEEAARALRELLRVTKPGGRIHLSVPFGRSEDLGWLRQLDRDEVGELFDRAGADRREETIFLFSSEGWRSATAAEAAEATYNSSPGRAPDLAVAARAVLCATIFA
ncbi:MAG TPA: methyltransferase domain-containing protein, partial [Solirubrobacterales bacterium]|nr:methyltransferase domain-containing protein [Solirubrobacterales bacterium]